MAFYVQSPDEKLVYQFAWLNVLPTGAAIVTSVWGISPTGPTLEDDGVVSYTTFVTLSGLTLGERYQLSNTITLDNGEVYEDSSFMYTENK